MESTFYILTVMGLDTMEIRHEIRDILSGGAARSKDLADRVIRKVGSEKTVYREIKLMCESGEIKKNESNRANITYELVDLSREVDVNLGKMNKQMDEISKYIKESHEIIDSNKDPNLFTLTVMVTAIKELQKFEARMKILSYFPAYKKAKQFEKINSKSDKVWDEIFHLVAHSKSKNFINELMVNFPYTQYCYPKSAN